MDENIQEIIGNALKGHDARYIEIRVEEGESTRIRYRGQELEEIGKTRGLGGCIRALASGWGFVSFNDLRGLREKVATAVRSARLVASDGIMLADVDPVVDVVSPIMKQNPNSIPLKDKKAILDQYVQHIWRTEGVTSSTVAYGDGHKKKVLATSDGTYIQQETVDVTAYLSAMARDGNDVQQAGVSLGANGDYSWVENLHDEASRIARLSGELLKAPQVKGGEYTVVLDPVLAGVFIHEAFGHLSEADHVYENQQLRAIMVLGRKFGGAHLNVVDGAAVPGLRGSYKYDDEGVPASRTYLLREGQLVGRLHSRETAAQMNEKPTGNARAITSQFAPIVRMTNTFIEPGAATLSDLLADIKEGIYVSNWYGGMTSMEQFTFSAGEAYAIRNGKIEELLRPVLLTGNLFTTLENLDAIANDLDMNQGGGCGKSGQSPLPVSNGSPHIRIKNCLISGR